MWRRMLHLRGGSNRFLLRNRVWWIPLAFFVGWKRGMKAIMVLEFRTGLWLWQLNCLAGILLVWNLYPFWCVRVFVLSIWSLFLFWKFVVLLVWYAYSSCVCAGRHLPDKAIDLVDEACANVRVQLDSQPEEIDNLERKRMQLEVELHALEKEKDKASKETEIEIEIKTIFIM